MQSLKTVTGGIRHLNNVARKHRPTCATTLGKVVSGGCLCASCVDITPTSSETIQESCAPSRRRRATRPATLARSAGYVVRQKCPVITAGDQTKHLSVVVESGAEVHLVCPAHKHFMKNVEI